MFNHSAINHSENLITPTIRYFIEKLKGNTELEDYEKNAIAYIKNNERTTPPDIYFEQKISQQLCDGKGTSSGYLESLILEHYEKMALDYVTKYTQPNNSNPYQP